MQTHEALQTISWIEQQFAPVREFLLDPAFLHRMIYMASRGQHRSKREPLEAPEDIGIPPDFVDRTFRCIYELGPIVVKLQSNPQAMIILESFGLARVTTDFLARALQTVVTGDRPTKSNSSSSQELIAVLERMNFMFSTVEPFRILTIPQELQSPDTAHHMLSITLVDRAELTIADVIVVCKATAALYDAFARIATGSPPEQPLAVVKIESGSSLTLSFKGVADIVKEVKKFVAEMWNKHRHKRADEIINHNKAVASSLQVLTDIDQRVKKRSLNPEDAERFKRAIIGNTLTLFEDGALLADIPIIEVIDNHKLIGEFAAPKLLTAPKGDTPDGPTTATQQHSKRRVPQRKKSVRTSTSPLPDKEP